MTKQNMFFKIFAIVGVVCCFTASIGATVPVICSNSFQLKHSTNLFACVRKNTADSG